MQKSVPFGHTSTAVNSWMPSMPLERRASSCWNHRFGSDGSTESCCSGCGDTEKLRCGVPMYFADSSEMMFSTRVVWLISSRRSSEASRFVVSTTCDTARSLATSVVVLRTEPPNETRSEVEPRGAALWSRCSSGCARLSFICEPLLPIAMPSASPS